MAIAATQTNDKKTIFEMLIGLNLPNKTESFKSV